MEYNERVALPSWLTHFPSTRVRWPIATSVLIVHALVVVRLLAPGAYFHHDVQSSPEAAVVTTGFVILESRTRDTVPIPEVSVRPLRLDSNAIEIVRFDSEEWGDISQIVAPSSAPQLSRYQPVDAAAFARQAGLAPGQVASVVLVVEVLPDGTVGNVEIARGCGNPAFDAAAVAYGRLLRWIPGTREHQAEAMRISLPVTLVWNA